MKRLGKILIGLWLIGLPFRSNAESCLASMVISPSDQFEVMTTGTSIGTRLEFQTSTDIALGNIKTKIERITGEKFSNGVLNAPANTQLKLTIPLKVIPNVTPIDLDVKIGKQVFHLPQGSKLTPTAWQEKTNVLLGKGSKFKLNGNNSVSLVSGSTLYWTVGAESPKFNLTEPIVSQRIGKTSNNIRLPNGNQLQGTPGDTLQLNVAASGTDIRETSRLRLCIKTEEGIAQIDESSIRFSKREGQGLIFDFDIPKSWPGKGLTEEAELWLVEVDDNFVGIRTPIILVNQWQALCWSLALLLIAVVVWRINQNNWRFHYISVGRSGRLSLSNFQLLGWTILVLLAYVFVWRTTGSLLTTGSDVIGLLGISVTTAAGARVVAANAGSNPTPSINAESVNELPTPKLTDLFASNHRTDVLRFQMLAFNVFTWVYVASAVWSTKGMPEISENLYLLLTASNGGYVGGKIAGQLAKPMDEQLT